LDDVTPLRLFVTGGTGFVGRAFLDRLARQDWVEVRYLRRHPDSQPQLHGRVRSIPGALEEPASYRESLTASDVVVHLAAVTGKARREEYFRVNTHGTRNLLDECARARVPRFVYVSTIAAGFRDTSVYFYAASKSQAEDAVRGSGMRYAIVRPTIILGTGSPVLNALSAIACAPVIPLFGDGRVRVQPILVDDVAECLIDLVRDESSWNGTIDLGGPEVLAMEDLLQRIRKASGREPGRVVHLPARAAIAALAALEHFVFPLLPVTAGQLSAFVNDSVARPSSFLNQRLGRMKHLEEMLRAVAVHA
jgi:nucleoside-diphosphate-sugar epimerase